MLHIAMCDDEKTELQTLQEYLEYYMQNRPDTGFRLFPFSSGRSLLNYVDEYGGFDLYIMDVIMPETNGIEVGLSLRSRNEQGLIIYLTASPDFAVESYGPQAFYYLLKPVAEHQFFDVLDSALQYFEKQKREVITVKTHDALQILPLHSILYAELAGRAVRYHTSDGSTVDSVTSRKSFQKQIAPLLEYREFILCGSSFAVNLYHVTAIGKSGLTLSNGLQIPVSRSLKHSVKEQLMGYWLEE